MPIASYSVLKGRPTAGKVVTGSSTHYQITVQGTGGPFTIAVNIQSVDGSEVLYGIVQKFVPPSGAGLDVLATGVTALQSKAGGLALDFVREQINGRPMVTKAELTLLPTAASAARERTANGRAAHKEKGHAVHDASLALSDAIVALVQKAIAAGNATIYAFGSAYADSGRVDGIHNIHMNQGNPVSGGFAKDNGVWQDGAMFLEMPGAGGAEASWTAVFIAFQTESWSTDGSGNPV